MDYLGSLITGLLIAIPYGAIFRRTASGVPFWFRPKHYNTVLRPYNARTFQHYTAFSRQLLVTIAGGWFFAHRYTDYSELLDENYQRGKVKLAAEFRDL